MSETNALTTAMILAAGRGERLRPITDTCPKPLVEVGGQPLIAWHLQALAKAGIQQVVINHAWLGEQIEQTLGNGERWGLRIHYSPEPEGGLETAGGVIQALPTIESVNHSPQAPFVLVNGDVFCEFDFAHWQAQCPLDQADLAHLVVVPKPPEKAQGDFGLAESGSQRQRLTPQGAWTFSGLSVLRPALFAGVREQKARRALAPLLREQMAQGRVSGEVFRGRWLDVGTPERLAHLRALIANKTTKENNRC
ncbi:N-acetylmuramate alpha-1-phosphate uridylyltransferase MurU [Hydrogenovibrio halophilus]|uniref:N-acetylmuramate alpha-1-phosphate uridylyltransferase MurU n=1 Tax=Hydrogenovibrio halophilus TaxID=373391 RepID=UPI00036213FB|nr:nucleotidyltransferase family protein [Hydrogenovibrio halophilus]